MNQKELGEIRRRFRPDHNNIQHIYGCYVNTNKEIISTFDESLGLLSQTETEKYLGLLKKTLSGALGKNLLDISFATKQVMDSEEHRLLSALHKSELQDASLRESFYRCIIDAIDMEDRNYLILLAYDVYDVPHYSKDGSRDDEGGELYKYLVCSICPVKEGKAELGYQPEEKRFHSAAMGQIVTAPELGFLFPTFDDRTANIYNALFYSKNTSEIHGDFVDAVFRTQVPLSAGRQKELCRTRAALRAHHFAQGEQGPRAAGDLPRGDGRYPGKQRRRPGGGGGLLPPLRRGVGAGHPPAPSQHFQFQPHGDRHARGQNQRGSQVQLSHPVPDHRRAQIPAHLRRCGGGAQRPCRRRCMLPVP